MIIYKQWPILLFSCAMLVSGCRLFTNSRPGMQIIVNKYFDEDEHIYPALDDHIFKLKMRLSGVLTPQKFVKEIGFWIFLTEPHDPNKIPIVMVHGHWSGPPVFKELSESIDTSKYELWFTYYPTGLDINESVDMFQTNLGRLANYYHQDEVYVLAYSMGGPVARQMITTATPEDELPRIPLFIGVANSWDGSMKTNVGAKTAIAANPDIDKSYGAESWKQVYAGAPYIRSIFDYPMPEETEFHMIYSFGGNDPGLPGRNDGVLHEASLARKEALEEAASVTVLEKPTHKTIIGHYLCIKRIIEILAEFEQGRETPSNDLPTEDVSAKKHPVQHP